MNHQAGTRSEELLAEIREHRAAITEQEIGLVRAIAEWAGEHTVSVDDADGFATITERGLDTGLPVAGEGAPLISDFAVLELSALLGRSLDSGRHYVGQVVELAYRLPRIWARVLAGEVAVWRALRIADLTRLLAADAAGHVDRHLAGFAAGCSWAQVDRLVEEALVRFDPDAAEERQRQAQEHRHVDTGLGRVGFEGIAYVSAALDAADALDLEVADPESGEITKTVPGRRSELVVHLSAGDQTVGRWGNTRTPISVEQVKTWLDLSTSVIVRPVVDLAGHQSATPTRSRPDPASGHHPRPPLRLPALRPTGGAVRPRPRPALRDGRTDVRLQPRPTVPGPPSDEDRPARALPDARARHLPLDPAQRDLPGHPHRHPRPRVRPPSTPPDE